jgi:hypothetical protein
MDQNAIVSDTLGNPAGQVADLGLGSVVDLATPATDMTNDEIATPTLSVE